MQKFTIPALVLAVLLLTLAGMSAAPAQMEGSRPDAASAAPLTDAAQRMYQNYGPAVYQVQVIDQASNKKAAIGSGFQLDDTGLMATNYHVVAETIKRPGNNRLEFLHEDGSRGLLQLLAVDVVNDLALLRMDKPGRLSVTPGTSDLQKGTRVFALGNPHDIGFSIVEGTHNGRATETFHDKIHFSGAINQGMSGGPALSADGRVVGINVMTGGNQIGFLVPVEALTALIDKQKTTPGGSDFLTRAHADIESQLVASQAAIMTSIMGDAGAGRAWDSMGFGPLLLPGRLHPAMKCWGAPQHEDKDPYRYFWSTCYNEDSIYLSDTFETGIYYYRYDLIEADESLWLPRFNSFYESRYAESLEASNAGEGDVSKYVCHDSFIDQAGRRFKASFCTRQYKKYKALYDTQLHLALVDGGRTGLIISVNALGVTKENALAFTTRFLAAIKPRPLPVPSAAPVVDVPAPLSPAEVSP